MSNESENLEEDGELDRMSDKEIERVIADHYRHQWSEFDCPPCWVFVLFCLLVLAVKIVQLLLWFEEISKR